VLLIADTLRLLGQGTNVAVEVVVMAMPVPSPEPTLFRSVDPAAAQMPLWF
jgi:hypothetical protein